MQKNFTHAEKFHELSNETASAIIITLKKLTLALGIENYNILQNNGKIAHQAVFLYPVILLIAVNFIIEIQIFFCLSYYFPEFLRPHVCTVYPVSDLVFILEWLEQIVFLFVIFVLLILKAYKTLKPSIYHTSRLSQSLIYWQLILILLIPWAIITTLDIAIHSLLFKFKIDLFHENHDIFINSMQFPLLFVIILLLSYISIRYPEGVLIFEAQLQRTINKYSIIKSKGKDYKFSAIQEYISYIHEEFFE